MTVQHEKEAADVNNIIANFARTGAIPEAFLQQTEGQYADVSELQGDPMELAEKFEEVTERLAETEAALAAQNEEAQLGQSNQHERTDSSEGTQSSGGEGSDQV